jgi:hypothetical protein
MTGLQGGAVSRDRATAYRRRTGCCRCGSKVDISQFPPPDSLTDPELAGPVQLLKSGKFDIPIESLTGVDLSSGTRGTVTLPLYKGAVNTPSGLRPAWYVILDASNQAEADRLGVNFSKKLRVANVGDAARPATLRDDGTFLFESGLVDFSPNRVVVPGPEERPFPPKQARPGSVGDQAIRSTTQTGHFELRPRATVRRGKAVRVSGSLCMKNKTAPGKDHEAVSECTFGRVVRSLVLLARWGSGVLKRPHSVLEPKHQETVVLAGRPDRTVLGVKMYLRRAPIRLTRLETSHGLVI